MLKSHRIARQAPDFFLLTNPSISARNWSIQTITVGCRRWLALSTVVGLLEVAAPMFPPSARPVPQTPSPAPDQDELQSGSA